jgi:hypothetical protein
MPVVIKKLSGGGDKDVERMMENASVLGLDLIELLWIKDGSNPRHDVVTVVGYEFPNIGKINPLEDSVKAESWVDGILKFYPDAQGRCWGYVYDTLVNREKIITSLSSGWYRVVDKSTKEALVKEAEDKKIQTEIIPKTEENVHKTQREINAERYAKDLEAKVDALKEKLEMFQKEQEKVKNIRNVYIEKRIQGTAIPVNEDPFLSETKKV